MAIEAEEIVTETYWKILGRAPDAAGLKGWKLKISTGAMTKEGLEQRLKNSAEYIKNPPLPYDKYALPIDFYPFHVEKSGYGILAKNIIKTLSGNGYRIINRNHIKSSAYVKVGLHVTMPPYFRKINAINIGYTMFEASRIPDSWVQPCNMMDILLVPLQSNIEIFRSCGVRIPIHVVPIGIDAKFFNPDVTNSNLEGNAFKFLAINDAQARKNNGMIVRAFHEEFGKEISEKNVELVFRTNKKYEGNGIVWISNYLDDAALASLIKSCDCMINASSGEAGDIPILAGMSMAKPVIVSKELAHSEYVEDNVNGFFITGNAEPAFKNPEYVKMFPDLHDAIWFQPSMQSLKEKMRYVFENRAAAQQIGKNAREYVLKNRANEVCLKKMLNILSKYVDKPRFDQINEHVSNNPLKDAVICEIASAGKWKDPDWLKIQTYLNGPAYQPPVFIHRKGWEWVQCIYGLEKLGVLTETAAGLGVGVGHEPLIHYFSNKVGKVIATDLYDENSDWAKRNAKEGDPSILTDLDKFAPFPYSKDKIEVRRMNGCDLKFPDNTFDFVWSCSSIEHFGGPENAAIAMREIERVLKPGGIAAIATEFILEGPQIYNVPNLTLFGIEGLYKYIISSHNMKLVQPVDFSVDDYYMKNCIEFPSEIGAPHTIKKPHMVLRLKSIMFTSIFLFFRKE